MRFKITFELPIDVGNALEKDPKGGELLGKWLEQLKPEAGYMSCGGRRRGIIITNADSEEELAMKLLPFWHTFKTYVEVEPVLTLEEFGATFSKLSKIAKHL